MVKARGLMLGALHLAGAKAEVTLGERPVRRQKPRGQATQRASTIFTAMRGKADLSHSGMLRQQDSQADQRLATSVDLPLRSGPGERHKPC